jgi:hypothetical protein
MKEPFLTKSVYVADFCCWVLGPSVIIQEFA